MNKDYIQVKESELENIAKDFSIQLTAFFENNKRACIVFLKGDLGSGKTTFTKKLGKILGINETIISPTFILRKDYGKIIHVDGYRFEKEEEGKSLALDKELNDSGKVVLIEWPERFVEAINLKPDFILEFIYLNDEERNISIKTI
ncbi:tRNA threonylcarbamoyladenosine biosynthesis protein TsaE [bioreactor metagenome]|uniref:tRNA threonylcarbamoyladenosine biosynthesis protein TsaE n=1 Tax=bioreactor metagenome TaxID=1076179 RepID=A0A644UA76_9ZZZZ|nr:tRNA (adenosine(37)-N6)-threonylcarbamoyltransferase complex ATPase subunit type 1 TsaE [Candidatus Elulimicrobiales bacterium]